MSDIDRTRRDGILPHSMPAAVLLGSDVMASSDQLKALIKSHADGDDARFYAVAMQVAAHAARSGHGRFALELRELVDKAKESTPERAKLRPVPVVKPRGELAGLLTAAYPKTRLVDMVLDARVRGRLERVLVEQRQHARLLEHGFRPVRKLLLVGPPGTGKTMTASALAGELALPLFKIQLDGLITKFMGETASKLRLIFDAIEQTRAVYLFDEFDALRGDRGAKGDVGEIRRVLNSFLQFIEQDDSESLIVCATNHAALLDEALFRRFDAMVEYAVPSAAEAESVMKGRLSLLSLERLEWAKARRAAVGLSHAEIVRASEQAAKNAILDHTTTVTTAALVGALRERQATRK